MFVEARKKDVWWTQGLALEGSWLAANGPRRASSGLQLPETHSNQILEATLA